MSFIVKNNAESTVADSPLAQAAVTLNVAAGEGANFPSTFPFLITLWDEETYPDPTDDPEMEIVKGTARTTDALTIVRAQEGTADVAHANGERVAMLITAGIIDELIAEVAEDTTPQLGGTLDTNAKQIRESKGADVASASALPVIADGNYFDVTGTNAITSINTLATGTVITLHFDAILILTHNATDLILPGGANITTAAGDEAIFREYATGDWRCIAYTKASGTAIIRENAYGVKWNGATSALIRTGALTGVAASSSPGDALLPCQASMRRCVLNDPGVEQYFLEEDDGYNRLGFSPTLAGTDDAGAASKVSDAVDVTGQDDVGTAYKVSDVGMFPAVASAYVGKYVHNTTDDTYSLITAKDSNDVLSTRESIMANLENFVIGPLSAPASEYVGKYVHNISDNTYALITAKDGDAALSIDVNIMANGETFEFCTAGIGDGGDGQVMTKLYAFHYRFWIDGDGYPNWAISPTPFDGSSIHHDFIVGNEYVPYIYIAAYKGSMYDASAGAMTPDANIEVNMYAAGDKLCSLSGEYPKTNETRDAFRKMATQRGLGWSLFSYDGWSALDVLYLTEFADFNSQSMIGTGRTMFTNGAWEAANQGNGKYIGKCGYSNADGNATNATNRSPAVSIAAVNTETDASYHDYMSYRGIEWFGNVWEFVDLININDHVPYVCNDPSDAQDDTTDNYIPLDVTLPASDNYQQTLLSQDRGFLPATVGADASKIPDRYWQNPGWRVVLMGGVANDTAAAGVFAFLAAYASSHNGASIGGRLVYKPITVTAKDYKHEVAMTDDTAWTGAVPQGYMISEIIFVESGGVASTLDLGTTSGGNDIFVNQVIAANSITTVVINKTPSMSARKSLYLNDDDAGSAWGVGSSITAIVLMRRVLI